MPRPTTANVCRQEFKVTVSGQTIALSCTKGAGHAGSHAAPVHFPPRAVAPPPARRV